MAGEALLAGARGSHMTSMTYLIALLLPPLAILLAGRPIVAPLTLVVWLPAIVSSGGLGHPVFVVLAWILIWQGQEESRARRHGARD